jgi:hypothetical protein
MFTSPSPSTSNLFTLITSHDFLARKLPRNRDTYGVLENHLGQIELLCLIKHLKHLWHTLDQTNQDNVVSFLINKTEETLGAEASCFTLYLKDTINGLIILEPSLTDTFSEIILKRRNYYKKD